MNAFMRLRRRIFEAWVRCPMGFNKTAPADRPTRGAWTPLRTPEPGYPLSGCVPAEPDSVSPSNFSVSLLIDRTQVANLTLEL